MISPDGSLGDRFAELCCVFGGVGTERLLGIAVHVPVAFGQCVRAALLAGAGTTATPDTFLSDR